MSATVMKQMNSLMKVPEIAQTMDSMRREMARAEITDELIEDAFAESDDEAEVDSEVAKVFEELGLDTATLMDAPGAIDITPVPAAATPAAAASAAAPAAAVAEGGEDPLMARLQALQK